MNRAFGKHSCLHSKPAPVKYLRALKCFLQEIRPRSVFLKGLHKSDLSLPPTAGQPLALHS